jgi:hypothetical protein
MEEVIGARGSRDRLPSPRSSQITGIHRVEN